MESNRPLQDHSQIELAQKFILNAGLRYEFLDTRAQYNPDIAGTVDEGVDNPEFLSDAFTFSSLKLESKDSTSLQLNAIKIYQDLIQFHLKDEKPHALADVDIERL